MGRGVPKDPDACIDALRKGEAGDDYSCAYALGDVFSHGYPGSREAAVPDMEEACRHYDIAAGIEDRELEGEIVPPGFPWPAATAAEFTRMVGEEFPDM